MRLKVNAAPGSNRLVLVRLSYFDPRRLVRLVKEIGRLGGSRPTPHPFPSLPPPAAGYKMFTDIIRPYLK